MATLKNLSDFEIHETCNFLSGIGRLIDDYSHLENLPKSIKDAFIKEQKKFDDEFNKRYSI